MVIHLLFGNDFGVSNDLFGWVFVASFPRENVVWMFTWPMRAISGLTVFIHRVFAQHDIRL